MGIEGVVGVGNGRSNVDGSILRVDCIVNPFSSLALVDSAFFLFHRKYSGGSGRLIPCVASS